ncbi:hypothetical protein JCM11251_003550 [Rhodosporidiobolus azoricus]
MSLDQLNKQLEGKIDFVGQDLADQRVKVVLWTTAFISFLAGFIAQDLRVTFGLSVAGFLGCLAFVVPPLPAYNSHPVKWLDTLDEYGEPMVGGVARESLVEGKGNQVKR